jgi:uncharacterized repeat protein (TIGR04052 family)
MKRIIVFLSLATLACGPQGTQNGGQPVSVTFAGKVGAQPFDCAQTYSNIGQSKSTIRPLDFRLFIREPRFLKADGTSVDLALTQDKRFQKDRVALLDFENNTGKCVSDSPETHVSLEGTVADVKDITALAFDIGFPESENHLDAATAPAPMNAPGMWWSWQGGYKFMRIDVTVEGKEEWYVHLGSDSCKGDVAKGYQCGSSNMMKVQLDGFVVGKSTVNIDLAALYAGADLTSRPDGKVDFVAGCMSSATDPDCPAIFKNLGLKLKPESEAVKQSVFTVVNP